MAEVDVEVVVLVEGVVVVVVVIPLVGLERLGAVGATDGLCATAMDAVAARIVSKVVGLMVAGILLRTTRARQASRDRKRACFYLFSRASKRRAGNASAS
jgi:hypothetical protein